MKVPPFSLDKQLSEIGQEINNAVLRVLESGKYIGGEEVRCFEESFSRYIGTNYSVSCNSGTDALVLALRALGIGKDDEVITSSFSFFATAEAISNVGAKPVFVDIETNGYLIDLNLIEKAINSKTKAILPVHLFGCPVDMDKIMDLAGKYQLKVIEDCAQAAGAKWKNKSVGSWGDVGCFSFFPTKNLGAAGDGGAITTNDDHLARKIRELAVHGMPKRYFHTELGYNSRLDALQAAILNVKLPKLSDWIIQREKIAFRYIKALKQLPGIHIPDYSNNKNIIHGWNQFVIKVTKYSYQENDQSNQLPDMEGPYNSKTRDIFKLKLDELGVQTIIYYPVPIHLQPAYKVFKNSFENLDRTEETCSQVLSLPIFPEISEEQQDFVINAIKTLINESRVEGLTCSIPGRNTFPV
ncbi:DegT/DnrJ/EryC1/StrS family aminotransferase [Prochlorococcus sp. MIT 1223]|uniref:DegT/DnrJ/EryC1/StrS family aminotransferase n=1 Tax=Prochlorococcus sp. MIT 1223 TaxID=3096217 RepID=UPI002A765232|nr:DegT/DnrJ/EryC1/StrS family aminotransferase [Prochlorococcus sp. MIT 1223]